MTVPHATSPHRPPGDHAAGQPEPRPQAAPARKVASYRLAPALARRVRIFAAMHDMPDYKVVEDALTAWLDQREAEG
jgi:hypothetical protein